MSEAVICDQCGTNVRKRLPLYEKRLKLPKRIEVLGCGNCGLVFLHPQPTHAELSTVYAAYEKDYDFVSVTKDRVENEYKDRLELVKKRGIKEGNVLDIGAGVGGFLYVFKEAGFQVKGTEFSQEIIDLAFKQYGVRVDQCDLTDLKGEKFHIIHSHHVLEHVREPRKYFNQVADLLEEDGLFIFEVPNEFWNIVYSIRRMMGRPQKYPVYPSLHHLFFYKKSVLLKYLKQTGLQPIEYKGYHNRHFNHPNAIYRFIVSNALKLFGNLGFGTVHFFVCTKSSLNNK